VLSTVTISVAFVHVCRRSNTIMSVFASLQLVKFASAVSVVYRGPFRRTPSTSVYQVAAVSSTSDDATAVSSAGFRNVSPSAWSKKVRRRFLKAMSHRRHSTELYSCEHVERASS